MRAKEDTISRSHRKKLRSLLGIWITMLIAKPWLCSLSKLWCFSLTVVPWIIPSLLKTDKPIMASGVTACILTLGLHRLGKTEVPVYDGSWTEWAT